MPLTWPLASNRTLVPISTGPLSLAAATAGVVKSSQIVHGQVAGRGAPVVNDQVNALGMTLPESSVALADAVNVVLAASAEFGVNVATVRSPDSVTVPGTPPPELLSVNCSDDWTTGSSNVTVIDGVC